MSSGQKVSNAIRPHVTGFNLQVCFEPGVIYQHKNSHTLLGFYFQRVFVNFPPKSRLHNTKKNIANELHLPSLLFEEKKLLLKRELLD